MIEDNVDDVTKKELFWLTSNIIGKSYNSALSKTPKYSKQLPILTRILQLTATCGHTSIPRREHNERYYKRSYLGDFKLH